MQGTPPENPHRSTLHPTFDRTVAPSAAIVYANAFQQVIREVGRFPGGQNASLVLVLSFTNYHTVAHHPTQVSLAPYERHHDPMLLVSVCEIFWSTFTTVSLAAADAMTASTGLTKQK